MRSPLAKAERNRRFLGERAQHVESRSRQMTRALRLWMRRFAQLVVEEEQPQFAVGKLRRVRRLGPSSPHDYDALRLPLVLKSAEEDRLVDELRELLRQFAGQQMTDAANAVTGIPVSLSGAAFTRFMAAKEVRIQNIAADTRAEIRAGVREIISGALEEVPRPSTGAIARRIRNQYFGPEDEAAPTVSTDRAALIARTELVQAENTGIVTSYETLGIQEMEWLAFTGDRKSGRRKHWKMDGVRVKVGEKFTTPLKNKLRYPGDPTAPIEDTANCRCTVAPVRRKS